MFQPYASSEDFDGTSPGKPSAQVDQEAAQRDPFIAHYFKRIDPSLAASFNADQCAAIKEMFGARGVAKHALEVRRSVPIGRRRYYLVLLMGRERRTFDRLFSEGAATQSFTLLGYAITALLWMIPAVGVAFALQALL